MDKVEEEYKAAVIRATTKDALAICAYVADLKRELNEAREEAKKLKGTTYGDVYQQARAAAIREVVEWCEENALIVPSTLGARGVLIKELKAKFGGEDGK